jgi:proteic killer suppression protein
MYTVHVYNGVVIKSFADAATEDIYNGANTKAARRIDRRVWPIVVRKLDVLNAATSLNDLKSPGNQLERLKDEWTGYWSIRVNDQYRIIFRFADGMQQMSAVETFINR